MEKTVTTSIHADEFLDLLNTFGVSWVKKEDLYAYFSGDKTALNKYQGDSEVDLKRRVEEALANPADFNSWLKEHPKP